MSGLDVGREVVARARTPRSRPADCPARTGRTARLGALRRSVLEDVNRDVDEVPPGWAATAVASRRALRDLRVQVQALGADGVVGVTFTPDGDGVVARGVTVRRRRVPAPTPPDEAFTTHLSPDAADLAVEAGLVPRRLIVTAVRAALHDPADTWPEPAFPGATVQGTLDHLVGVVRRAADEVWRGAGRRRGPATVLVGDVRLDSALDDCPALPAVWDAGVVLLATATVLAGAPDASPAARAVAEGLDRYVVPLAAGSALVTGPFVAALGVDDLLLLGRLGLAPAGVVLGYSLHAADRVDPDALPDALETAAREVGERPAGEDTIRTAALEAAWSLAHARVVAQAEDLGADGVVGLDVRVAHDGKDGRYSVAVHGTAVRSHDLDGGWRADSTSLFLTTLSGRDVWLLAKTGYRPLGLVFGASTGPRPPGSAARPDGELPDGTQAVYDARDRALARVRAEADVLGADGVVALHVEGVPPPPGSDDVRVVAWGTAVRTVPGTPPADEPQIVLPLLGGRP